jgi:hypothetical protein
MVLGHVRSPSLDLAELNANLICRFFKNVALLCLILDKCEFLCFGPPLIL